MKVYIYCANSPPSPVLGSYCVLYHIATPRTPSAKYIQPALLFEIQQILKCLREIDRQVNDSIVIDSQFRHTFCTIQTSTFYSYEMVVVECVILWDVILYTLPGPRIYSRPYRISSGQDQYDIESDLWDSICFYNIWIQ